MREFKCIRQCDNCKYHLDSIYACGENECAIGIKPTDPLRNEKGCIYTDRQLEIMSDAIEYKANAMLKSSCYECVESDAEKQAYINAEARKYSDLIIELDNVQETLRILGPQTVVMTFLPSIWNSEKTSETRWSGVEKIELDLYNGYLYLWSYGKKDAFVIPAHIRIEN